MKERWFEDRLFIVIWSTFIAYDALFLALILLAPLLKLLEARGIASAVYGFLHLFCHQRPERSWFIFGEKLGVCVRCLATYLFVIPSAAIFFIAGVREWLKMRSFARFILPLALASLSPLVVDGLIQLFTPWVSTSFLRFLTGALAGTGISIALGYLVIKFSRKVESSLGK